MQQVAFHPTRSHFLVATQQQVRIYDLAGRTLVQTLQPGVRWLSGFDLHPQGDNVVLGSFDKRVVWHDLELGERPYRTLRHHDLAVRAVRFSTSHPLWASAGDDGTVHVFHATVSADLATDPMIAPVRILRAPASTAILDLRWHPHQPWVIATGADGLVRLWTD